MANPYFKFKKFTIWHDKCAMKVGTDGVLLGAWANVDGCVNMLDVGTGTGLIALMLAQRYQANIDAIDIDMDACFQAKENIESSPFALQIDIHHISFLEYVTRTNKKYDLIVSNPPYFTDSLKCPDKKRTVARHTDSLVLSDLINGCCKLLSSGGRIALIVPFDKKEELTDIANSCQLYAIRTTHVIPVPEAAPKRLLVEYTNVPTPTCQENTLVIEEARHQYTPEFKALTKDYYLK
ncbi:tRNA1(Val) (adenine(37)-N6)-methyltransferase [Parabacteroides bouchesdurhonensis]|uniref:tRNA1(Val) (adenine(37)-N6)-methyltransferase n=1 Tax=Parabacteroides bouchesdurhonensis TaxID=1936995 RepID=UPI000E4F654B|nr:methyltransferase [Parabacteroides bouchesdurhonensis]RHJ92484.1 methyltransferase domain-containing protein [Bacteroides sp. AM07-16]